MQCGRTLAPLVLGAVLVLGGCDVFEPRGRPSEARLRLEAQAGISATVATSRNFVVGSDPSGPRGGGVDVIVLAGDTLNLTLPVERRFDIRSTERFFVEVLAADSLSGPIRMQVWIDEDIRYDQTAVLEAGGVLRFIYVFNG